MQPTLLDQGAMLMLVGMGTVFVFLTLLVAAMSLMAWIIKRWSPTQTVDDVSDEEIAVITAAIVQHQKNLS